MSELKAMTVIDAYQLECNDNDLVYLKSEADKVIKEKDKEIARLDDLAHAHNIELLCKENLIAEVKAKLESVQASAYAESVDAGMENRKLKRAMWLARAERAIAEQTIDEWSRYKEKHPFGSWRADPFEYWVQAWIYVEKLCRKKAKEYK